MKKNVTFRLEEEIIESIRDIAYNNRVGLDDMVTDALRQMMRVERLVNGEWPKRPVKKLKTGKRIGA